MTPLSSTLIISRFASLIVLVSLTACGGGSGGNTASTFPSVTVTPSSATAGSPPSTATPTPAPTSTPIGVLSKTPLHGLVSMGTTNFKVGVAPDNSMEEINAHPGVYVGAVINVFWSQLEPQPGVFDDSAIDSGLASITTYNVAHAATPVTGKLRIRTGNGTPSWVLAMNANGPITVNDSQGSSFVIGAFWSSAYRTAWQGLQAHLASRYDANPALQEVAVSSCSSITAEPFIVPLDAQSLSAMRASGYSDAADMACLSGAPADYANWTQTPLDYTFNTFRNSDGCATGSSGSCLIANPAVTTGIMQSFRSALGSRSVLANHGLQPTLKPDAMPVYAELLVLGPAIEFQTISPVVDWDASVRASLAYHPTELEIWQTIAAGGPADVSQMQLQTYANEINSGTPSAAGRRRSR